MIEIFNKTFFNYHHLLFKKKFAYKNNFINFFKKIELFYGDNNYVLP